MSLTREPSIDAARLLSRLRALGAIGRDADGALTRLAASDADKAARDTLCEWMSTAGLTVEVDAVGNVFGRWGGDEGAAPIVLGSHIDTVVNAGIYDGAYGVLAALEVVQCLREPGAAPPPVPARPLIVAAFTNEEGVRYTPDMMGSLVYAGGLSVDEALAAVGTDGTTLGAELARIGYAGAWRPGPAARRPHAYLELHIEQGPVLEHEGLQIGSVESLQGISWQRITIDGEANHAGTTPMSLRRDAGYAAARITTFLRDYVHASNAPTVATVGTMAFEPNAINVIPARATLTVDLRDPDEARLAAAEAALAAFLVTLAAEARVRIASERLVRFEPVTFDARLAGLIDEAADRIGASSRRMTSGAGHDAQMLARICPAAMIFVPSVGGISHSPREHTAEADLVAGARVLLEVTRRLLEAELETGEAPARRAARVP